MWLRFCELSEKQQRQARQSFLDAGTVRDNYWYEINYMGRLECRTKNVEHTEDYQLIDENSAISED